MTKLFMVLTFLSCGCHVLLPFSSGKAAKSVDARRDTADSPRADHGPGDVGASDATQDAAADSRPRGSVVTLAGVAEEQGHRDGPADQARFQNPAGICVDGAGHVYVAEESNHTIRKIEAGDVSTVAGEWDRAGFEDGPVGSALFDKPSGVVVNAAGDLFVADNNNHRIRKISAGTVSTVAGSGDAGGKDGPADTATFSAPHDLALGLSGEIVVFERNGHRVRLIKDGNVTTLAGGGGSGNRDGPAGDAQFNNPSGGAVDLTATAFEVLVADSDNHSIRIIANNTVSTVAGRVEGHRDGTLLEAEMNEPADAAYGPSGEIYVVEFSGHYLRRVAQGKVETLAGDGTSGHADGPLDHARFNKPHSVAVDSKGIVYVTDWGSHVVRMVYP